MRNCQAQGGSYKVSKIIFSLKRGILSLSTIVNYFSYRDKLTLLIFEKKQNLSIVLSSKNGAFYKRKASSAWNSKKLHANISSTQPPYFVCSNAFVYFLFHHTEYYKHVYLRVEVNHNNFKLFVKDILKWNWQVLPYKCMIVKKQIQWQFVQFGAITLICAKSTAVFCIIAFAL